MQAKVSHATMLILDQTLVATVLDIARRALPTILEVMLLVRKRP